MEELYWIHVLGNANSTLNVIWAFLLINILGFLILMEIDKRRGKKASTSKKGLKITIPAIIVVTILLTFIPSKKELYLIYGVDSTIDNSQLSPKAKKVPENAIKAINKWLETEEQELNENKQQ